MLGEKDAAFAAPEQAAAVGNPIDTIKLNPALDSAPTPRHRPAAPHRAAAMRIRNEWSKVYAAEHSEPRISCPIESSTCGCYGLHPSKDGESAAVSDHLKSLHLPFSRPSVRALVDSASPHP